MSNKFCRYLTNGLRVQSEYGKLAASPCCYLPQFRIDSPDFDEQMAKYHQKKTCVNCLYYVNGNRKDPSYPPNRAERIIEDVEHTHPVYAELSIDNLCNAACMSCTDFFSTLWQEQNKKFGIKTIHDYPDPQDDEKVANDLFNKFDFSYLRELNFLGGEPLISKANFLVLEKLVELGVDKNIRVLFTTNGSTRLNDKQIEILKNFERVTFSYSIDGIGDRFHYLRYPLKWEKLLSVIESAREASQQLNLRYVVNSTVSCLSAFYVDEVETWVEQHFKDDPLFVNFHTPPCTDIMSPSFLPVEAKEFLKNKYKNNNRLKGMFLSLDSDNEPAINKVLDHFARWDHNRGLDWKQVFPDAVPFYEKYLK